MFSHKIISLFLGLFCAALLSAQTPSREIHISIIDKSSVNQYLNRLATEHYQVVATLKPVKHAMESVTVTEKSGERLHFVEAFSHMLPALEGEIIRFHNIIVVSLDAKGCDNHTHYPGMPDLYMEVVALKETVCPKNNSVNPLSMNSLLSSNNRSPIRVKISSDFLKNKLKELSGATPVTIGKDTFSISERRSRDGREKARQYLRQEYEKLGFTVSQHHYNVFSQGTNFVAEKKGQDSSRYFVISAHYDTVNTAGADDDGSGVIACLAIAEALHKVDLKYSLRILAFDQEESGLVGSKAYAAELNKTGELDRMIGLIQIEMLGYDQDQDGGYHAIDCQENTSPEITDLVVRKAVELGLDLSLVPACTNRSDHASFWTYDKPAIVISENFFGGDSNPCYHRRCDTVDMMDFNYMNKLTTLIGQTVADVLGAK